MFCSCGNKQQYWVDSYAFVAQIAVKIKVNHMLII